MATVINIEINLKYQLIDSSSRENVANIEEERLLWEKNREDGAIYSF